MKVVWKRPDGFHGACPSDFEVVDIASKLKIWLHKTDRKNFPFRVSGGWQDEDATHRLNQLINLLNQPTEIWLEHLKSNYSHSESDLQKDSIQETSDWISQLKENLKGDTWEIEVMSETLLEVERQLGQVLSSLQ